MSRVLKIDQGDYVIQVDSENGARAVIDGDFLVKGAAYGTAPVVSNILYVTMDGSDTNDGTAADPTKACRTISGAVKSPKYTSGTAIKVAPGHYFENNPIVVKPYTSIMGSDLRTTTIEPINKTQDVFHVNSSCYISQLQIINGRSGIVDPMLDRGAYAVAFPINYGFAFTGSTTVGSQSITNVSPIDNIVVGMEIFGTESFSTLIPPGATVVSIDSANNTIKISSNATATANATLKTGKITVYKSPYIQNCTNQSGPWLYDGAMFVPNQTVQIPVAVGTTTFGLDGIPTDIIDVVLSEGAGLIEVGMSINTAPQNQGFFSARALVFANIQFIQEQVLKYISDNVAAATSGIWYNFTYDSQKCSRDIRIIIEHVMYDTTFGGNSKSIQCGKAYWDNAISKISGEIDQTIDVLGFIKTLVESIIENSVIPDLYAGTTVDAGLFIPGKTYTIVSIGSTNFIDIGAESNTVGMTFVATGIGSGNGTAKFGISQVINASLTDGAIAIQPFNNNIQIIENILTFGTDEYIDREYKSTGPEFGLTSAELLIINNRTYLQNRIDGYITTNYPTFVYDRMKCKRDLGYIIDALAHDTLLGGNSRTIEVATAYYNANHLVLTQQELLIWLDAFTQLNTVIQNVIRNISMSYDQTINLDWMYGEIASVSIEKNVNIIKDIVENGTNLIGTNPSDTTKKYRKHTGTALFSATGISADDIQKATKILNYIYTDVNRVRLYLDNKTVGVGNNSTLYFGWPSVYPAVESTIPSRWSNRKCDPWGSMGGMLIDGDVVTTNSPIRSFVADAFTQVNQGGRGIRVTNRGYVQLVSVFTIFSSIAVQTDNGGIASITNSNANFGKYCMISKGYGPREFSGTVYNPTNYTFNSVTNEFDYNEYYPSGFFPNKQQICVFLPDIAYRPHISLMMEILPPSEYINAQGKPGFLTATITLSTITKGELSISGVNPINMFIGQRVYIYDQYGNNYDSETGELYILDGTVISDMDPETIYLSKPVNMSGGDLNNPNYFTLFTCGNAYYTILSSTPATNPTFRSDGSIISLGDSILPEKQITTLPQPEISSLVALTNIVKQIVQNEVVVSSQNIVEQVIDQKLASTYDKLAMAAIIDELMTNIITILGNPNIVKAGILAGNTDAEIVAAAGIDIELSTTGVVNNNHGDAAKLILSNLDFCVEEITAYIEEQIRTAESGAWFQLEYNSNKCRRDVKLICVNLAYDLTSGGNYNSVYSGLSYFSKPGTYHIVEIEDNVRNSALFPDGALVNFYQRSYMSASGYLFEYIGSGTNYGALPQVGRSDPIQENEVNMLNGGKVFFTSTDQNGDFRIGPDLVISQATGVLSGRTFQKSLFAEMTPFILAIEG
jgi:hypothetical protein